MSVIIALVPLAIALAGALANRKKIVNNTAQGFCLDTGITDIALLRQAFSILDYQVTEIKEGLSVGLGKTAFQLVRNENGSYDAVFPAKIAEQQGQEFIQQILGEYGKLVQQQVYQRVKTEAKNKSWTVENETVQEDNSILLTLQV
jgi:hypothetical protein